MSCAECQELINAYLDGELEEQQRDSLGSHLATCPDCSREEANLRACFDQLRQAFPEQTPPPELWKRIQVKTETEA